jgi:hypothetical protein
MTNVLSEKAGVAIECANGWNRLIEPIVDYINEYNETVPDENKIKIKQIKEKFGGLRFYAENKTDHLKDMIEAAEHEAIHTCEICGGKYDIGQTADGWITTCCRKCIQELATKAKRDRRWYSQAERRVIDIKYGDSD